jgi:hypothetical protein
MASFNSARVRFAGGVGNRTRWMSSEVYGPRSGWVEGTACGYFTRSPQIGPEAGVHLHGHRSTPVHRLAPDLSGARARAAAVTPTAGEW